MRKIIIAALAVTAALFPVTAGADVVDLIQKNINDRTVYVIETGGHDMWTPAKQNGDCEDFALAKRAALLKKGYAESDLQMLFTYQPDRLVGHVVLYIASEDRVLDLTKGIGTESMARWQARTGMVLICRIADLRYIDKPTGSRCEEGTARTIEEITDVQLARK